MANSHPTLTTPFADRAATASHPLAAYLLRLMDLKASNLCLSADVSTARELLVLADRIGPSIVIFKTHHDMVAGWDNNPATGTGARLAALARKHGFLIFEDRKFGDIGNTVQLQYTAGSARIIDWAHIVNVNMVPGPAVVAALADAAARWKERYPYEVKTSVSVGTPRAGHFDDDDEDGGDAETDDRTAAEDGGARLAVGSAAADGGNGPSQTPLASGLTQAFGDSAVGGFGKGGEGRKGSIVSITTVTQHYEPASSPRGSGIEDDGRGDNDRFPGIEDPPTVRGLLILAQMSSKGNFMTREYTQACVEAARRHKDFVMGFVSQESLNSDPDDSFVHMTPGCQLPPPGEDDGAPADGDGKGQQYNTPQHLVGVCGVDVVVVGRGILNAGNPQSEAERYRREAWRSYLSRIHQE